ncbi:Rossmann-like domain-containing protein [Hwanghaeella sp.]|uniref:Rossmann-like domain-containing protein n=1 Tax=Hwanghaeella sp. TaxID=2605943 RepID=UPI003CCBD7C1
MKQQELVASLIPEHAPEPATRIAVGVNWTLVDSATGTGLVHTPVKSQQGCVPIAEAGSLRGRPLRDLMDLTTAPNPIARAVGFAALNAYWNRHDITGDIVNGLELVEDRGHKTVIIGRFPNLDEKLPGAAVIERNPGPDDFPEDAAATLIPQAEFLVITASTLSNGSLAGLLALRRDAFTVLVGPGTPLCSTLFDYGIGALAGFRVDAPEKAEQAIMESGAEKAIRPSGTRISLVRG